MAVSSALSKSLPFNKLDLINKLSSIGRPCLVSFSRFHPLSGGHHSFHAPMFLEDRQRKKRMAIKSSIQPIPPSTDSVAPPMQRKNWIMELLVRLTLPFLKSRWGAFLSYKKQVDKAIETAEKVVEVVEKVAEEVEMKAEELVEELPDGNIKHAVNFIENVAHQAAKEAHFVDGTILKVEEFEDEVDGYIDPNLSKARRTRKEANDQKEQAFERNHFDILGGLFANHFNIVDCLLYHLTSFR